MRRDPRLPSDTIRFVPIVESLSTSVSGRIRCSKNAQILEDSNAVRTCDQFFQTSSEKIEKRNDEQF
jgi:hypothetical protein